MTLLVGWTRPPHKSVLLGPAVGGEMFLLSSQHMPALGYFIRLHPGHLPRSHLTSSPMTEEGRGEEEMESSSLWVSAPNSTAPSNAS